MAVLPVIRHLVGAELLDLLDPVVPVLEAQPHVGIDEVVDGRDHVIGAEGVAVVEFHVVAQLELVRAVVDPLPCLGEPRHEFVRPLVITDQGLVDGLVEDRGLILRELVGIERAPPVRDGDPERVIGPPGNAGRRGDQDGGQQADRASEAIPHRSLPYGLLWGTSFGQNRARRKNMISTPQRRC